MRQAVTTASMRRTGDANACHVRAFAKAASAAEEGLTSTIVLLAD
jgi:hypothetical protein